jgi:hypothetical protein
MLNAGVWFCFLVLVFIPLFSSTSCNRKNANKKKSIMYDEAKVKNKFVA